MWEHDKEVVRRDGSKVPVLELKGKVKKSIINMYRELLDSTCPIPCQRSIHNVEDLVLNSMLNRVLVERLEEKGERIKSKLDLSLNDWEYVTFYNVGKYLIGNTNAIPFEILFTPSNFKILTKERNTLLSTEALLFGLAGFLNIEFVESYPKSLKKKFEFLKSKYQLEEMDFSLWKFMRMYPSNFPSVRLSQFAALIFQTPKLFKLIIETNNHQVVIDSLSVTSSLYWNTHFNLGVISKKDYKKRVGEKTKDVILVNAIAPLVFVYGERIQDQELMDKSIQLLEKIKPEKNLYMKKWSNLNVEPKNAFDSQALLQLYNQYCKLKKCLNCTIGNHLIKSINNDN